MKKNHNKELGFKIPKNYFEESNNKLFDLSVNKKRNISNLKSLSEFIPYSIAAIFIIGFFVINSNQNIDNNNSIPGSSAKRIQAKITPKIGWNKLKKVTFPGKYVFKT